MRAMINNDDEQATLRSFLNRHQSPQQQKTTPIGARHTHTAHTHSSSSNTINTHTDTPTHAAAGAAASIFWSFEETIGFPISGLMMSLVV
jgi:hypothetical protein